jgi:hypothetical protein
MHVEGSLERILDNVVPHEVAHTVVAHYFRRPVPRWADEGIAVLSEGVREQTRHDRLLQAMLKTAGRTFPLKRLFSLTEFPSDRLVLYTQGQSVASFLVEAKDRKTFLAFVKQGMGDGWDKACQAHYNYETTVELEQAWLEHTKERLKKCEQEENMARGAHAPGDVRQDKFSALIRALQDRDVAARREAMRSVGLIFLVSGRHSGSAP